VTASSSARPALALIQVDGLSVRYGDRWALDTLSFQVQAGELVGLLGPNGAGKTTTLSVLATLLRPDTGRAAVGGYDAVREAARVRAVLGLVPQTLAIYPTLTARENLLFFARLFRLRDAPAVARRSLHLVGLEERADDIVATFSGGMQRRLNLACGLLHEPRVVLLDEPTVGVDPQSRERIFEAVRGQASRGAALLYSTHQMEEAERLCDRVVLIDGGRVVAAGTPAELIERAGGGLRLELRTRAPLPEGWLDAVPGARILERPPGAVADGDVIHVSLDDVPLAARVLDCAAARGAGVIDFHLHRPSLQDVFLKFTGHALRD
jgi:linearmycin/streptolysin S transport system ATP-binding protein